MGQQVSQPVFISFTSVQNIPVTRGEKVKPAKSYISLQYIFVILTLRYSSHVRGRGMDRRKRLTRMSESGEISAFRYMPSEGLEVE